MEGWDAKKKSPAVASFFCLFVFRFVDFVVVLAAEGEVSAFTMSASTQFFAFFMTIPHSAGHLTAESTSVVEFTTPRVPAIKVPLNFLTRLIIRFHPPFSYLIEKRKTSQSLPR